MTPETLLDFWFNELERKQWYVQDSEVDHLIIERFLPVHSQAASGELYDWRSTIDGRLAEIIILDQFSRNIFRDKPEAFATDALALILSQEAISTPEKDALPNERRAFLYMPFMHSESKAIHEIALQLFSEPGVEGNLDFELRHKTIIDRFGRYPHRNKVLGRSSTPEEIEFLKEEGSSF